jgi:hypothetical protein
MRRPARGFEPDGARSGGTGKRTAFPPPVRGGVSCIGGIKRNRGRRPTRRARSARHGRVGRWPWPLGPRPRGWSRRAVAGAMAPAKVMWRGAAQSAEALPFTGGATRPSLSGRGDGPCRNIRKDAATRMPGTDDREEAPGSPLRPSTPAACRCVGRQGRSPRSAIPAG